MVYIVFERAKKEFLNEVIESRWHYHKIPKEAWEPYDQVEVGKNATPDIYVDAADNMIDYYSERFPSYHWRWTTWVEEDEEEEPEEIEEDTENDDELPW